jgi:hypothetical protein
MVALGLDIIVFLHEVSGQASPVNAENENRKSKQIQALLFIHQSVSQQNAWHQ